MCKSDRAKEQSRRWTSLHVDIRLIMSTTWQWDINPAAKSYELNSVNSDSGRAVLGAVGVFVLSMTVDPRDDVDVMGETSERETMGDFLRGVDVLLRGLRFRLRAFGICGGVVGP
jgi:hypothetical protein